MTNLIRGQNTVLPTPQVTADVSGIVPGSVDLLVFQVRENGKVRNDNDFIFYNQPSSPEGAVRLSGTGSVAIDVTRVPPDIHTLRLAVSLDDKVPGNLGSMPNLGVTLGGITAAALGLTNERAAVLVEIYRRGDQWKVRNVSAGWERGLAALATEQGVSVADAAPPAPPPPPVQPYQPPVQQPPPYQPPPTQPYQPPTQPYQPPVQQPPPYQPPPTQPYQPPAQPPVYPPIQPPVRAQTPPPPPPPPVQPAAPPAAPVNLGKITLTKANPSVSLAKSGQAQGTMRVNLNWTQGRKKLFGGGSVDLDLACLYELQDGDKGVVQALGRAFGDLQYPPYIMLDGDDRSGSVSGGENLHINLAHISDFKRILIFAYIYEGAPNWAAANAVVTLYPPNSNEVEVRLDSHDNRAPSCAIAQLTNVRGELIVNREVRYVQGVQRAISELYHWGLDWTPGRK